MVWNDFFDVDQDRRERPFRPIPSGRVPRRRAALVGGALMVGGVSAAVLAGWALGASEEGIVVWQPVVVALLLAGAIFLYDGWLKRTPLGPLAMGTCRTLNVFLGLALTGGWAAPVGPHLAAVVGLYVAGVTWLARTEARQSSATALAGAGLVMLGSLLLALPLPLHEPVAQASPLFPYLLVVLAFVLGLPIARAVREPTPRTVQAAVRRALMALIVLDAILATSRAGSVGLLILLLLIPARSLQRLRWLYAH